MSEEGNQAVVHRYFEEVVNQGNVDVLAEVMAENVLGHDATDCAPKAGFERAKQVTILFHTACSHLQCPIDDILARGDKLAVRRG